MKKFNLGAIKKRALVITTAISFGLVGVATAQESENVSRDAQLWAYVQQLGNVDAYAAYLAANSDGEFADMARAMLREFAARGTLPDDDIAGIQEVVVERRPSLAELLGLKGSDEGASQFERTFVITYVG